MGADNARGIGESVVVFVVEEFGEGGDVLMLLFGFEGSKGEDALNVGIV